MPNHVPKPCPSCGTDFRPVRSNQKLCRPCRLLRDLEYWNEDRTEKSECSRCKGSFYRYKRDDKVCGKCEVSHLRGKCIVCATDHAEIHRFGVPICLVCLKSAAPEYRTECILQLRKHIGTLQGAQKDEKLPPAARRALAVADSAATRLGITREEALNRAKMAMGLAPGKGTNDYAALEAQLNVLQQP